jgi:type III pantothenate kinase
MRILMISQHYPPFIGGYGMRCAEIAGQLRQRDHPVLVLASRDPAAPAAGAARGDGALRVLARRPVAGYQNPGPRDSLNYLGDRAAFLGNWRVAARTARRFRPDVVCVYQFDELGIDVIQGFQGWGCPVVLDVADLFLCVLGKILREDAGLLWRTAKSLLFRTFARELDKTDMILIGDHLKANYVKGGFRPEQMTVIPSGVDPRYLAPAPPKPGPGTRLLMAGRVHPEKGVDLAVEALAILNSEGRRRFTLDVVGPGADGYLAQVKELARRLGVQDDLRLLGPRDWEDLMALYERYDLLLFPSVCEEGFGRTMIEAMARGLPVIASRRGGSIDAITHMADGLLVEPESARAIAEAVRLIADVPALRQSMAEQAIAKVKERFNTDRQVLDTEAVLARAVERGSKGNPSWPSAIGCCSPRR